MSLGGIAVVGGGVAGLSAAYQLQKHGYKDVTVFEKEGAVGGKVYSYFYEGRPYELGAVWTTSEYKVTNEFCSELKVPRHAVNQLRYMMPSGENRFSIVKLSPVVVVARSRTQPDTRSDCFCTGEISLPFLGSCHIG